MFTAEHSLIDPIFTNQVPDADENLALNLSVLIQKFKDSQQNNETPPREEQEEEEESPSILEMDPLRSQIVRGTLRVAPENSIISSLSIPQSISGGISATPSQVMMTLQNRLETVAVEDFGEEMDDAQLLETYKELCADDEK